LYYVAAKETMEEGWLPRILAYAGAITVERTWRAKGKDVDEKKEVNPNDTENIKIALEDGWVITFPQGTTRSFKPVRKGTAHIILQHKPIVVPIVIDGFRRSFDRKGLLIKKKGILQSMVIKEPLLIDYETTSVDELVEMIEFAIEQHPSLLKVLPSEELEERANLDKERMWRY
jgi:1-acyl-sn-glycerol-3-phosphate acyltransferase